MGSSKDMPYAHGHGVGTGSSTSIRSPGRERFSRASCSDIGNI